MKLAPIVLTLSLSLPLMADVTIKNITESFNLTHEFKLVDGKIYGKSFEQESWELVSGGLPKGDFRRPTKIREISADNTALFAVDSQGYIYQGEFDEQGEMAWHNKFGLPAPVISTIDRIKLPKNYKSFAASDRSGFNLYYEDYIGNQFHYGNAGCTSFLILGEDGRELLLGDPWFPPDLSRQVCGPSRGRFIAENMAAGGSMIFLIAKNGEMYTRFYDYDVGGGTPFFEYSYDANREKNKYEGTHPLSAYGVRVLPPSDDVDWRKQVGITLEEQARITRNISVVQMGHGNNARELRVQGINSAGETGYYFKSVLDSSWNFQVTNEKIDEADLLNTDVAESNLAPQTDDLSFAGTFNKGKAEIKKVEIDDFSFYCSPITLKFTMKSGKTFRVKMHTVDSWTTFPEENVNQSTFVVKKLKGTIELSNELKNSDDQEIGDFVEKYLKPYDMKSFAFSILANKRFVEITKRDFPVNNPFLKIKILLTNGESEKDAKSFDHFSKKIDNKMSQLMDSISGKTKLSDDDIVNYVNDMGDIFKSVKEERKELKSRITKTTLLSVGAHPGLPLVGLLAKMAGVFVDRAKELESTVGSMGTHLGPILYSQKYANKILVDGSKKDYNQATDKLKTEACRIVNDFRKAKKIRSYFKLHRNYKELDLKWLRTIVRDDDGDSETIYCYKTSYQFR